MFKNLHALLGYPLLFVSGLEFLLALILLQQNPRKRPSIVTVAVLALLSSAFSLCTGVMYIQASTGASYHLFARLNWIGWFTLVPGLQFLYYLENERSRVAPRIGWALYPVWTIALLLSVFTDLMVTSRYRLIPFRNEPGMLDQPFRLFGAVLTVWIIVKIIRLLRSSSAALRREITYYFIGVLIFGGGAGLTAGLLQQFGGFGFEPGLSSYFSLPWVVLTFYAIARYQLFDVRIVMSRSIAFLTILAVLGLIQSGLFLLLEKALGPVLAIFATLSILGLLLVATQLRVVVERWVDALILRDSEQLRDMLRSSAHSLSTILRLDELLESIITSLRIGLGVEQAAVYLRQENGGFLPAYTAAGPSADRTVLPEELLQHLTRSRGPLVRRMLEKLAPEASTAGAVAAMRGSAIEVALPLQARGDLIGVITLGSRRRGPYTQNDLVPLETLAGHAATALSNAMLFQETVAIKESLRESEEKFRTLTETAPAAIIIHRNGVLRYTNPAAERLFGRERAALISSELLPFIHPDDRHLLQEPDPGRPPGAPIVAEVRVMDGMGEKRWVILSASPVAYQGSRAVIATFFDITDRKNLESKVRYMHKMEAIGKLAGGVAHDFNNILSTIIGQGNLVQASLPPGDPLHNNVDRIFEATERAAALTNRLLSFGARKDLHLRPCSLSALVQGQERFIASVLPSSVRLSLARTTELLPVLADASQLERVLMNLVTNARDAMPQGGEIAISLAGAEIDPAFIKQHGFGRPGRFAVVSVQDTGSGIDPSLRSRIFEPFFTTKGAGKGTGFGLSIVYDIVKEHRGYITVLSTPGDGTRFSVYLPLSEAVTIGDGSAGASQKASGTLLLADDDSDSRKHFRSVLEGHGFTVVEAVDGEDALAKFAGQQDIRLVITDVVMPRMNGRDLYLALRTQRTSLPFLFISGYSEDVLLRNGLLDLHLHFLSKPAMPGDIIDKTRQVLGL